jgi:hypothetical protein
MIVLSVMAVVSALSWEHQLRSGESFYRLIGRSGNKLLLFTNPIFVRQKVASR